MGDNQLIEVIGGIGTVLYSNGSIEFEGLDAKTRKINVKKLNFISGGMGFVSSY